jgi:hypothetical protein
VGVDMKNVIISFLVFALLVFSVIVFAVDSDSDGIADDVDNCLVIYNPDQNDSDGVFYREDFNDGVADNINRLMGSGTVVDNMYLVNPDPGGDCDAEINIGKIKDVVFSAKVKPLVLNTEGPQLMQRADNSTYFYFDYYHQDNTVRLVKRIGGASPIVIQETSFVMETDRFYDMKMRVSGDNVKCYIDEVLLIDTNDSQIGALPPGTMIFGGYHDTESGYFDDILITGNADDGVGDMCDNCLDIYNPDQNDSDHLIVEDDFENGNSQGWVVGGGTWVFADGEVASSKDYDSHIYLPYSLPEKFSLQAFTSDDISGENWVLRS